MHGPECQMSPQPTRRDTESVLFFTSPHKSSAYKYNPHFQFSELPQPPASEDTSSKHTKDISHGPSVFSCGCELGMGRNFGPDFKKEEGKCLHSFAAWLPSHCPPALFCLTQLILQSPLASQPAPFCFPDCCLQSWPNLSDSSHRWSRLGDSKTISCSQPRDSYQSEWTVEQFSRLSSLLLRHLGVPPLCPLQYESYFGQCITHSLWNICQKNASEACTLCLLLGACYIQWASLGINTALHQK